MKSEMLDNLKIFLSTEEGREEARKFFDEYETKDEEILSYFESEQFFKNLNTIKEWMIKNKIFTINDDDFNYSILLLPVSELEFVTFTSSILKSLDKYVKSDSEIPFANGSVEYGEWKVSWLSGQGYISSLQLCVDKVRDNIISKIVN